MSYRTITVDGIAYRYSVGRTHLKVRGLGVVTKDAVATRADQRCRCCGERLRDIHGGDDEDFVSLRVTPQVVADFIRRRRAQVARAA